MAAEDHVPENKVEGCVSQVSGRLAADGSPRLPGTRSQPMQRFLLACLSTVLKGGGTAIPCMRGGEGMAAACARVSPP
jgi:hypothetical protein